MKLGRERLRVGEEPFLVQLDANLALAVMSELRGHPSPRKFERWVADAIRGKLFGRRSVDRLQKVVTLLEEDRQSLRRAIALYDKAVTAVVDTEPQGRAGIRLLRDLEPLLAARALAKEEPGIKNMHMQRNVVSRALENLEHQRESA